MPFAWPLRIPGGIHRKCDSDSNRANPRGGDETDRARVSGTRTPIYLGSPGEGERTTRDHSCNSEIQNSRARHPPGQSGVHQTERTAGTMTGQFAIESRPSRSVTDRYGYSSPSRSAEGANVEAFEKRSTVRALEDGGTRSLQNECHAVDCVVPVNSRQESTGGTWTAFLRFVRSRRLG